MLPHRITFWARRHSPALLMELLPCPSLVLSRPKPQGSSLQTPMQDISMALAASVKITNCASPPLTDRGCQQAHEGQDVTAQQMQRCYQAV